MRRLLIWSLHKLTFAVLLATLGLTGAGLWIFLHDTDHFQVQQQQAIQSLKDQNAGFKTALINADGRMMETRTQISAQQLRADQAAKVARELDELSSGFNRLTTPSAQLTENEERLIRMKQMETDSRKRVTDLEQNLVRIQWEKDGLEIALERNQAKLSTVVVERSVLFHYAREAWDSAGKIVLFAVALVMLGLPVWQLSRR